MKLSKIVIYFLSFNLIIYFYFSYKLIDNDTGAVNVTVFYSAILLRPFRNEVLDTIVITATDDVRMYFSIFNFMRFSTVFFFSFIIIISKPNIYSKLLFHFWRFIWIYLIFSYFRFLIFCVFLSIFFLSTNYIFSERLLHTGRTAANFCQQTCKEKNILLLNKSLILRI